MANAARHNDTTTNHTEVLTKYHLGIETFVGLGYDNIIDVVNEVNMAEDIKEGHILDPDVGYHLELRIPNREVPTLIPRVYILIFEVECLGGRQYVLGIQNILWFRLINIVNHNPVTTDCSGVFFGGSYTATSISKDRQGSLFIILVSEPTHSVLRWHRFIL